MINQEFENTIDIWIKDIKHFSFEQICMKPSKDGWSLGQVCIHLIDSTTYFIQQISICVSTNENTVLEMTPDAKNIFLNNEFPNILIEGPATNRDTCQPKSKDEILKSFAKIKKSISNCESQISNSLFNGKTKHPGLMYFNASEWLQFAEMHFRHHLRQGARIKTLLKEI